MTDRREQGKLCFEEIADRLFDDINECVELDDAGNLIVSRDGAVEKIAQAIEAAVADAVKEITAERDWWKERMVSLNNSTGLNEKEAPRQGAGEGAGDLPSPSLKT
jgi:hypothetical protein